MQTDESLNEAFLDSKKWDSNPRTGKSEGEVNRYKLPLTRMAKMSLSGSERNHVFLMGDDATYVDVSGNSGFDSNFDGRSIGLIDFNRDGLPDVLMTTANGPILSLFKNQLGSLKSKNCYIALRFVGGHRHGSETGKFSNRDGVGVRVIVTAGNKKQYRELRCGEGLAAQNSRTLIIGIGEETAASSIDVVWPSGYSQGVDNITSGTLATFFENVSETVDGSGVEFKDYRRVENSRPEITKKGSPFPIDHDSNFETIAVFVAMATWCPSCKRHLPDLQHINTVFNGEIPVYAIPIDPKDNSEKLAKYVESYRPAYDLLPPNDDRGARFLELAMETIGDAGFPFSFIVSKDGMTANAMPGIPTISDLRKAMLQFRRTAQSN